MICGARSAALLVTVGYSRPRTFAPADVPADLLPL
jgi:hypothetical protein